MSLSFLEYYKKKSALISKSSPIAEQRVFQNTHNIELGIKDNASNNIELSKYSCTHHKFYEDLITNKLKGLTIEEFDNLKKITLKVSEITKNLGNENNVKSSLISAVYQKRIFETFFDNNSKVLEVGGGSGYLSLLLALSNYKISLYDVTEGYYLFQNLLFGSFGINNELAEENANFKDEKNKINHIPWWEFRNLNEKNIKFDVLMVNNAICEFNELALVFLFNFICKNSGYPKIIFIGSGKEHLNKMYEVKNLLKIYNYKIIKNQTFDGEHEVYNFEYIENYSKQIENKYIRKFKSLTKKLKINFFSSDINNEKLDIGSGEVNLNELNKFYLDNKIKDNLELEFYKKLSTSK